jgi:hypothetical protein
MAMAALAIHSLEAIEVAGPQNWKRGKGPKSLVKRARKSSGKL